MKCQRCKSEMLHIQKDGKTYLVCQNCRKIHSAEPSNKQTDTLLYVCLGFIIFSIFALLSGFILWGIAGSGQTHQTQDSQIAASPTKTLTRSDLIKQGKIKAKNYEKKSAEPTPDVKINSHTEISPKIDSPAEASPAIAPTENPTVNTIPPQTDNNSSSKSEPMVWLTATGRKYHNCNNCGFTNPDKAYQVTISYAEAHSDGPCKICFP